MVPMKHVFQSAVRVHKSLVTTRKTNRVAKQPAKKVPAGGGESRISELHGKESKLDRDKSQHGKQHYAHLPQVRGKAMGRTPAQVLRGAPENLLQKFGSPKFFTGKVY